ncbi:hypothetical protein ANN_06377 [Periplaneta americana]|uniref:Uncharacterized protein n=1 Tax=Periplaneta americana TaxID=6978 RepID=A0ABQ8TDD7_PERAM|nr:hypothetical protein ANN_06377 [Periplaneta americana]
MKRCNAMFLNTGPLLWRSDHEKRANQLNQCSSVQILVHVGSMAGNRKCVLMLKQKLQILERFKKVRTELVLYLSEPRIELVKTPILISKICILNSECVPGSVGNKVRNKLKQVLQRNVGLKYLHTASDILAGRNTDL